MNQVTVFVIFCILSFSTFAQKNQKDSADAVIVLSFEYGGSWSEGDLKDRFGYFNHVGATVGYKFKRNWYAGLSGNFMFGNQINIPGSELFHNLVDSKGNITDNGGSVANVLTFSRGLHIEVEGGRVFNRLGHNKNSGVMLKLGVGYLHHKIRIETNDQVVPQLEEEYRKGYDRYTSGIDASQFIGYLFMSKNSFLNFYASFFIIEGFTKNRRNINWDQPNIPVSTGLRLDLMYGFKIGWLIPVSNRQTKEFYYN